MKSKRSTGSKEKKMTTVDIDEKIKALEADKTRWTERLAELRNSDSELVRQEDALRTRSIRDGDIEAARELESLRLMTDFATRESNDLAIEIQKAAGEIEELKQRRTDVARDEAWGRFKEEAAEAIREAKDVEKFLQGFIECLKPHKERLYRMTQLARQSGFERAFEDKHLTRRFGALMRTVDPWSWNRQHATYDDPYDVILKHIFDHADAQRSPAVRDAANQ
jgi:hypothetical protein